MNGNGEGVAVAWGCRWAELTCVGGVGGSVEEAGGGGHAQVGHASAVAVHGGGDGVVVGLLRRGAGGVAPRRNAVGVSGVTCSRRQPQSPQKGFMLLTTPPRSPAPRPRSLAGVAVR